MPDFQARPIHPRSDPPNAGTKHLSLLKHAISLLKHALRDIYFFGLAADTADSEGSFVSLSLTVLRNTVSIFE
jgi:hypothetical protein